MPISIMDPFGAILANISTGMPPAKAAYHVDVLRLNAVFADFLEEARDDRVVEAVNVVHLNRQHLVSSKMTPFLR